MRRSVATLVALVALGVGTLGCARDRSTGPAPTSSAAVASCTPRSAEKLGIPFVRVCPPGEAGFWINAAPMGCSAGDHESVRCPETVALVHGVKPGAAPVPPTMAAIIDKETAVRLCYFRMGGHLPTRSERSKARAAMGLATVLVTESETGSERFHFDEVPEWVFEEASDACESGVPTEGCRYGWFPSDSKSSAVPWPIVRDCTAQYHEAPPPGVPLVGLGGGCPASVWSWGSDAGGRPQPLPCGLRSPALGAQGAPSVAAFTLACTSAASTSHPEGQDKDTAAYRCVLPESALGTFDLPGL